MILTFDSVTAQVRPMLPKELTIAQALDIALANSSTLRDAQAHMDQVSGQYQQARAALLPQIGVGAHQDYLTVNLQGIGIDAPGVPSVLGPFGSMDARLTLAQDLLNIANVRSWQSFSARRDASRLRVENAREIVVLNVVGAYLRALRARSSRDTFTEQTRLAKELYRLTADRANQGVSSQLDANRAKQQVNSLEQQRQEAEYQYIANKLNLANVLQAAISADFEVSDDAAYGSGGPLEADVALQSAFTSRPDYRAAEAAVKAAELQVKSIEASRLPTVRMIGADGQSGSTPVHNVNTYTIGGTLIIPVFTGGRIRGEIREAQGTLEEAVSALDKSRADIETDVLTAISGIEWALKELATSAENVGLSREEVDMTRARFLQGVADNSEVVNAQDRLTRADDARIRAEFTLGLARANLARAIGGAERAYRR